MSIKKMLLLASMALAVVAFAAPAAQANPKWAAAGAFEASGEITSVGGGLSTGPAVVHFKGTRANVGGVATASITSAVITGPVATNLPECSATTATSNASVATPWPVTFSTPDLASIGSAADPVTFTNNYSAKCEKFGVPPIVRASGIVTGTYEKAGANTNINLNNHVDDLTNEATGGAVNLTNPAGSPISIPGVLE